GPLIPILFFITPLFTAASPRLAPFLLPIVAVLLVIAALRRGLPWRDLLRPNAALIAPAAVAAYAGLSAIWAADTEAALSKCALLFATTLVVFAASAAIATLDPLAVRASRALRRYQINQKRPTTKHIRRSKSGKARHLVLTEEGIDLFSGIA